MKKSQRKFQRKSKVRKSKVRKSKVRKSNQDRKYYGATGQIGMAFGKPIRI